MGDAAAHVTLARTFEGPSPLTAFAMTAVCAPMTSLPAATDVTNRGFSKPKYSTMRGVRELSVLP